MKLKEINRRIIPFRNAVRAKEHYERIIAFSIFGNSCSSIYKISSYENEMCQYYAKHFSVDFRLLDISMISKNRLYCSFIRSGLFMSYNQSIDIINELNNDRVVTVHTPFLYTVKLRPKNKYISIYTDSLLYNHIKVNIRNYFPKIGMYDLINLGKII